MRGMKLSGITLMVVSLVLCLLSSSLIAGEHPWGRDNSPGTSGGTTPIDTTVIRDPLAGGCSAGLGTTRPSTEVLGLSGQVQIAYQLGYWLGCHTFGMPIHRYEKRVQIREIR